MGGKTVLRTAIGKTAEVMPIWKGLCGSERIALDLVEVDPLPLAFRRMIRGLEFDLTEMPVVTLAQAMERGVPITGIPLPVSRRFHQHSLQCLEDAPFKGLGDLAGRRIAVRSFPQTSGVWVRGLMAHEYGVALENTRWTVMEDAHVHDYAPPAWVTLASSGQSMVEMLRAGKVDAVAGLKGMPEGLRLVEPDADAAAAAWFARTGIFPVNHVLVVRTALLDDNPWLVDEITALFTGALDVALKDGTATATRAAVVPDRVIHSYDPKETAPSIQMLLDFAREQGLFRRDWTVRDLFGALIHV